MKANAKKAFNELKKKGFAVLEPELGWGGHFAISGEAGEKGLDYYDDFWGENNPIESILKKYGLFSEWVNPGVSAVYDA